MVEMSNAHFIRESLINVRKWCDAISIILIVIAVLLSLSFILAVGAIVVSCLTGGSYEMLGAGAFVVIRGAVIVAALIISAMVFRVASYCGTPFGPQQTFRLRIIGSLLIGVVIIELLCDFSYFISIDPFGLQVEYAIEAKRALNIPALVLAAVAFCMSVIFQYGALLQEDEDALV